jgi:threonine dehydrogenase-like Zn-dependent dehydrogenase
VIELKAAIFDGKNIEIKEIPKPTPKKNQVLVKVKNCGICGTDIAIYEGHLPTPTPIIPGHEFSGIIEEIGDNVDENLLGKRVACEINSREGLIDCNCYFCQQGISTNCLNRKAVGIDIDGAFTEYVALDYYLCNELTDNVSYVQGTFIEPLAAAVNTFELMPFTDNDKTIVIYGAGKLGLLIAQVAKYYSKVYPTKLKITPEVIVVSRTDSKLELAKKLGADIVINSTKVDPVKEILKLTDHIGADIVIDTTGNSDAFIQVTSSTRTRGKIGLKSTHGLSVPVNMTDIVVREINMYATRCGPFDKAIEFMDSGLISIDEMVSEIIGLSNIKDAFKRAMESDSVKIVIDNEK